MPYCCFFICLLAFWYGIYSFVTYKSFSWDVLFHKFVQETKIVYCSISFSWYGRDMDDDTWIIYEVYSDCALVLCFAKDIKWLNCAYSHWMLLVICSIASHGYPLTGGGCECYVM
jgi:hypothetical protein